MRRGKEKERERTERERQRKIESYCDSEAIEPAIAGDF